MVWSVREMKCYVLRVHRFAYSPYSEHIATAVGHSICNMNLSEGGEDERGVPLDDFLVQYVDLVRTVANMKDQVHLSSQTVFSSSHIIANGSKLSCPLVEQAAVGACINRCLAYLRDGKNRCGRNFAVLLSRFYDVLLSIRMQKDSFFVVDDAESALAALAFETVRNLIMIDVQMRLALYED